MKYLFMTLLAASSLPATSQPKQTGSFTITGKVINLQDGYVYLRYTDKDGKYIKDSAALQNGAFRFSGHIVEPTMASFSGKLKSGSVDDPNYTNIFLEPGEMNIIVADQAFKEAKLTGSVSQQEYASLAAQQNKIEKRWRIVLDTLHEVNKRSNFEYQELKDWVLTPYFAERKEVETAFIKSHPASYVTASILRNGRDYATDTLKKIYAAFPVKLQQSSYGKAMLTELENRKKGVPGAPAADFTTTDINGQPLSLTDYKGKYVLIDFWASWCLPCRKLNPHLKELYTQCGPKGFEVIGVASDDKTPDAWKKAVAQDGLPWRQILAGNIGRQYDIQELPTQILIDPNGKIIARYGSGLGDEAHAALDKKLETLFGAASSLQAHAPTKTGTFVVNGKYKGQPGDMLYLGYTDAGNIRVKDSCVVMDGTFSFKGAITEPTMAYLQPKQAGINNSNGNSTQLFLEPAVMQLNVDAKNIKEAVLTGSATQKEWVQFEKAQEPIRKEMEPLSASYSAAGKAYMDAKKNNAPEKELDTLKYRAAAIHDQFEPYNARIAKLNYHYFETHPTSVVTAYYLRFYVNGLPLDSIQLFYDRLGTATQQTSYGKIIAEEIAKLQSGSPGSMAKNFSAADINGKPLSLSNFKGKYVLVDFWASWCVPCRKGNPHLKELYAQYKEKGFEVIGVADDDRDTAAWHKAVTKDGLPWQHVLRGLKRDSLKGYDKTNDISELFGIHSLPTQVLIDPSGKIIARYGEGASEHAALDKELATTFKNVGIIRFTGTADPIYNGEEVVIYNRAIGVHDSAMLQNGQFTITAPYKEPGRYMFYSKAEVKKKHGYRPWGILVTNPGDIQMKFAMDSISATTVSGAPENDLYNAYAAGSAAVSEKNKPAEAERLEQFITANIHSFAAIYLLSSLSNGLDADRLETLYNKLSPDYKSTSFGQRIADKVNAGKITAIGKTAPDFEQPDTAGNLVKLSDFRGKYVLVDFWASWCGPCRAENPNVVKAFAKYNEKGFTVLGVSLDQPGKKDAWLAAIHKDGLTWMHVSDLKFWDNAVAKLYGIQAIPQNYLLNPQGKIIASNISGEKLNEKLAEIFKL